jgi:protein tyrosine phosphatase (PTP) superfamily phosphohydrolase (DUF442 family)
MPQTPLQAIEGVVNACQLFPTLLGGGQPGTEHLRGLKEAGVGLVLDLRDPMEPRPFDEPALLAELGVEYVNVPVSSGSLSDATLERILGVLRGAGGRPVFVHCASGNRVGGALIPHLMIDKGLSEEDAIAQAMRTGLRSAEMMEWGLNYAKRHTGTSAS